MCEATEVVLWAHIQDWQRLRSGRHTLHCRVGSGEATYYTTRGKDRHVMTFGARMVASKFCQQRASQWRTGDEIIRRAYFGGQLTLPGLLAHTCCHEFAHLVQCLNGWIKYGSVHNEGFYRVLDRIHQSGMADEVQRFIEQRAAEQAIVLAFDALGPQPLLEPAQHYCLGDRVQFDYKGKAVVGEIIKVNRKTLNVKPLHPRLRVEYFRISPHFLTPANTLSEA